MPTLEPWAELRTALRSAFQSEEFADLEVRCGPYRFKVHKVLLCTRSPWFAAACRKDAFKEGEEGVITLKSKHEVSEGDKDTADDPEAVRLMIHYFYHLDYPEDEDGSSTRKEPPLPTDPESSSDTDEEFAGYNGEKRFSQSKKNDKYVKARNKGGHLVVHAKLYALADKYEVPGLKALSLAKFKASIHDNWDRLDSPELASAIHIAYTSTADENKDLRRVVEDNLMSHLEAVLEKPEIACATNEVSGLALRLLLRTQEVRQRSDKAKFGGAG
ncbi:hypothetical protein LTR66_003126 [Elasticomyces elasticus]|nr:hypothetical protein LTR50_002981 [Elasticomyces elasticus]KAK4997466.1 hypothetical protein LTR66_003126 [Elasticomyces elasticus]KAK5008961.1 hypothetical protein LTR28_003268 [Elasticomyces elasticus]